MQQVLTNLWGEQWWCGGYYELELEFASADRAPGSALEAIWARPELDGCYRARDQSLVLQERVQPCLSDNPWLYGRITLPFGAAIPCGTCVSLELAHSDFVAVCIPLQALSEVDPRLGGYPFDANNSRTWREPLDAPLVFLKVTPVASAAIRRLAFESAKYLNYRNPNSLVLVRDLQSNGSFPVLKGSL